MFTIKEMGFISVCHTFGITDNNTNQYIWLAQQTSLSLTFDILTSPANEFITNFNINSN